MSESAVARRVLVGLSTVAAVASWFAYVESSDRGSALIWAAALTSVWVTAVLASFLWSIRDALHRLAGPAVTKTAAP